MKNAAQGSEEFIDRSGWIIAFGVIQVLTGLTAELMAVFIGLLPLLMQKIPSGVIETPEMSEVWPGISLYIAVSVLFIWLGIGSFRIKRWANALTLAISWFWLAFGTFVAILSIAALVISFASLPSALEVPAEIKPIIISVALVLTGIPIFIRLRRRPSRLLSRWMPVLRSRAATEGKNAQDAAGLFMYQRIDASADSAAGG